MSLDQGKPVLIENMGEGGFASAEDRQLCGGRTLLVAMGQKEIPWGLQVAGSIFPFSNRVF